MKKITIEIPAEWVKGVPTPVDDEPIKYKFKVGDEVMVNGKRYKISARCVNECVPAYNFEGSGLIIAEAHISGYAPQDITERIKTFDDACRWCVENGKEEMLHTYSLIFNGLLNSESEITEDVDDIIAYLKLRIITCALNEGWEPTYEMTEYGELDENIFVPDFGDKVVPVIRSTSIYGDSSAKLCFKSESLAIYAAKQFADIYADFCGMKKGGKE